MKIARFILNVGACITHHSRNVIDQRAYSLATLLIIGFTRSLYHEIGVIDGAIFFCNKIENCVASARKNCSVYQRLKSPEKGRGIIFKIMFPAHFDDFAFEIKIPRTENEYIMRHVTFIVVLISF